jgi:hypothetical protein
MQSLLVVCMTLLNYSGLAQALHILPQRHPSQRRPQPRVLPLLLLQSPAFRGLLPEAARQNSV